MSFPPLIFLGLVIRKIRTDDETLSRKAEVRILEIESFLSNWFHCRPIILPVSPLSLVFPSVYHFHPLSYALSLHFHPVSSLFQIPIPFHPPPFVLHRSSCTLQSHFTSYVFSFPLPFPSFVPASTFNSHPSQLLFASYFHTSSPYSLPFHLIIHPPSPLNFSSLFSITSSSPPFPHCSHVLTLHTLQPPSGLDANTSLEVGSTHLDSFHHNKALDCSSGWWCGCVYGDGRSSDSNGGAVRIVVEKWVVAVSGSSCHK